MSVPSFPQVCSIPCSFCAIRLTTGRSEVSPMPLQRAAIAALLLASTPVLAFDDKGFCVVARQLAHAAEKDVGIWIDRVTRNAGMAASCDLKVIEFTRFTYIASTSMTAGWKAARSSEWNASLCSSPLWREAIDNGWTVALAVSSVDGSRATFKAQCR